MLMTLIQKEMMHHKIFHFMHPFHFQIGSLIIIQDS